MDLSKTFLKLAGIDEPSYDGVDLLPILNEKSKNIERTLFWRSNCKARKQKAFRMGKWKYILDVNCEMLFDLEKDIAEKENLFYQFPEVINQMKSSLALWQAEMDKYKPKFKVK